MSKEQARLTDEQIIDQVIGKTQDGEAPIHAYRVVADKATEKAYQQGRVDILKEIESKFATDWNSEGVVLKMEIHTNDPDWRALQSGDGGTREGG